MAAPFVNLAPMGTRWQRLLGEVSRFLAVGGAATVVALFLFNLLVHGFNTEHKALLDDHVIVAYVIANTVGMVVSYRGSRSWAFRDRPPRHSDGGRMAFVVINLVTMTLPIGCLWISRNVLGLLARFYLFRTYVFRHPVHLPHLSLPHLPESSPLQPVEESVSGTRDPS